jgi:hypothetical protein
MSKRNSRAAKAARRATRGQRQDRNVPRAFDRSSDAQAPAGPVPFVIPPGIDGDWAPVVDVHLYRIEDEDGPYVSWHAEWALRDSDIGIEESGEDLRELVSAVVADVRGWSLPRDLTLEWEIEGDVPAGKTPEDMVTEAGVTLPRTLPRASGITSHHVSKDERETSVWTPERMKNAKPMPFPLVPGFPSANLPPGEAQKPATADPPEPAV